MQAFRKRLVVVIPRKACFGGEYEAQPINDMYPNVEDTNTIFPPFLFSRAICLATAYSQIRTRVTNKRLNYLPMLSMPGPNSHLSSHPPIPARPSLQRTLA